MFHDAAQGWFTSSYSDNQGGQCVEARRLGGGPVARIAVRDSKTPDSGVFEFEGAAWTKFLGFVAQPSDPSL